MWLSRYSSKLSNIFKEPNLGYYLNKLFGPAYIKNLKTSVDRKNFIIEECNSIDLEYKIIEAIDGTNHCDDNYTIVHGPYTLKYPVSAGFLGALLTTQIILSFAIAEQLDHIMILDDDCIFSHTNKINKLYFANLENNLPNNWDIIILGSIRERSENEHTPIDYYKCVVHGEAAGSHGIVVNRSIFKEFYQHLIDKKYWGDGIIGHFIDIGKNVYIIKPSICQQNRQLFSDINKCHHSG